VSDGSEGNVEPWSPGEVAVMSYSYIHCIFFTFKAAFVSATSNILPISLSPLLPLSSRANDSEKKAYI
jgi:hypothetical protein